METSNLGTIEILPTAVNDYIERIRKATPIADAQAIIEGVKSGEIYSFFPELRGWGEEIIRAAEQRIKQQNEYHDQRAAARATEKNKDTTKKPFPKTDKMLEGLSEINERIASIEKQIRQEEAKRQPRDSIAWEARNAKIAALNRRLDALRDRAAKEKARPAKDDIAKICAEEVV